MCKHIYWLESDGTSVAGYLTIEPRNCFSEGSCISWVKRGASWPEERLTCLNLIYPPAVLWRHVEAWGQSWADHLTSVTSSYLQLQRRARQANKTRNVFSRQKTVWLNWLFYTGRPFLFDILKIKNNKDIFKVMLLCVCLIIIIHSTHYNKVSLVDIS